MHGLALISVLIASVIEQLSSAPVVFHWRGEDAVIEAVSMARDGRAAGFWCEGLHGSNARCFAQAAGEAPAPIFRGGALDAADRGLQRPFAGVRHFSMTEGCIGWKKDVPVFFVACHTGAITGVCEQVLGEEPRVAGSTISPLDSRPTVVGEAALWNDVEGSQTVFRAGDQRIDVCCAGQFKAYAAVPAAGGGVLLVYAAAGKPADLEAALLAPDLRVKQETVLVRGVAAPTSIDAAATPSRTVVVWSGGGVFAEVNGGVKKLSDNGGTPVVATDGMRVIAAWLERDRVITVELSRGDLPRSLLALDASVDGPFLALNWSPSQGFVAHWRSRSTRPDDMVIVARPIP